MERSARYGESSYVCIELRIRRFGGKLVALESRPFGRRWDVLRSCVHMTDA